MEDLFKFSSVFCFLEEYFLRQGMNVYVASYINLFINLIVLVLLVIIINYIIRRFVIETFNAFTNKTKTTFDDFLVKSNFPKYVGQIFPLILINYTIPYILINHQWTLGIVQLLVNIYAIILGVWICRSLLRTTKNFLKIQEEYRDKPIDSYIQVVIIFIWVVGIMFIFSEITGRSVINFAISLGAASAILLLIFKDTILGFVASIQVSVNDIVRIGDWITFSKYGADGTVTEINLATVRVQNWDNTYTTIPTYSLIADSFQNWRGMQESPGRRIKRAIFIKQSSVKFVDSNDLEILKRISLIAPYLDHRQKEIERYNLSNNVNKELPINGRNQTNLGIFRKYVDAYLHEHSAVHKEMYIIVRHLAPTSMGIPLEILCFSRDKRWENFEYISADIFDHVIAAVPYFGLKLFESPSGDDIREYFSAESRT
ncbi:mechanosensitive ion channel family protein [Antarcticibacterium sp. 1MA-6-2]|uniref:mechanosensitive ion channel family protein n=1 Tax=Antarcticibacterium sp. 1MA-6-2 TaxID=2908210 RepID=UPI001F22B20E|nr:mechanosensitive ion channel domain-containing protein [Antarcticibacterium sp. 1MA-6-2]UJH91775.1 mechanosensitive ion channel family protein [Antarcticibacterium sp. 1MA-6-2]